MKCPKCGAELPEGSMFCNICGKKVTTAPKRRASRAMPNGAGSVYRRGKTWECAVTLGYVVDEAGKCRPVRPTKGGFRTKKEAMEYLPILKNTPQKTVPSLMDLWGQYKTSKKYAKLSASRQEKYEIAWKKLDAIWFWKIDALTTFDLQNAVDSAADTYYPARDLKDLLSKLYQTALPDEFVSSNLAEFIELPEKNAKQQQAFTQEEIAKLWNDYSAGNWWTGYILLMIYTGMMPGELLDARKSCIDWEGKQITGAGKKTDKRRESPIVLADFIIPVLSDLCDRTSGDKVIRINRDRFYDTYYKALERAGCRRLPPYTCRHTAASTLALEAIPPSVIQKIMRHARFTSTEKYIHISIDPMLDAVNKLKKTTS